MSAVPCLLISQFLVTNKVSRLHRARCILSLCRGMLRLACSPKLIAQTAHQPLRSMGCRTVYELVVVEQLEVEVAEIDTSVDKPVPESLEHPRKFPVDQ